MVVEKLPLRSKPSMSEIADCASYGLTVEAIAESVIALIER
jgi:hypothetical protein